MDRTTGITLVAGLLALGVVLAGATVFDGTDVLGTDDLDTGTPGTGPGDPGPVSPVTGESDPAGSGTGESGAGGSGAAVTGPAWWDRVGISGDGTPGAGAANVTGLDAFEDSAAFSAYVRRTSVTEPPRDTRAGATATPVATAVASAATEGGPDGGAADGQARGGDDRSAGDDTRVADTNVQVGAVDEPALVKTNGEQFFYAAGAAGDRWGDERDGSADESTYVVDAAEPSDPKRIASIDAAGRQLLVNDTLVVLGDGELVGYDVSDPADPTREWSRDRNGSVVAARATGGQVYLVLRLGVRQSPECPVEPMDGVDVDCGSVYHPEDRVPVDGTYVVLSVAPETGAVTDSVGFVGSRRHTVVYMNPESLYVTYADPLDRGEAYASALLAADVVPSDVKTRIRQVEEFDLSPRAERYEVEATVENWLDSLDEEERDRVTDTLSRQVESYLADNARNFSRTGVVRVAVDDGLSIAAHGTVPGRPLNQFSLGEHEGTLRIATTVPGIRSESENDLYTLDATNLTRVGEIQGMGEDQEIFAVRYVGDTAYLVTFRRVDPFHVVDLSDPSDPVEKGVLELPGFSSYLHPVDENHVLGIGREDGRVKAVLFDVSNATDPTIADSKVFDRSWSRVSESHHAFLIDRRHGVFFMPAGEEGLVVDYANESLAVETTVDTDGAVRARYVGDYLYVFGRDEIAVVDERTWNRTATVELD